MPQKYYQIFATTISEMFVWKLNFVLWRFRTVLQLLIIYFLWSTVFLNADEVFGYQRAEILTYVILGAFLRSFVGSSRSQDIAGEIKDGELTNYLSRPVSYFGWWMVRDLADKAINVGFVIFEIFLIWLLFRPPLIFQSNEMFLIASAIAAACALILYFHFSLLLSLFAFWITEVWGIRFLALTAIEFLAGGMFPLDILPKVIFNILQLTPFPYIIFFPSKIYLGQLSSPEILTGFAVMCSWILLLVLATQFVWKKGLAIYGGEGR